MSEHVLLPPEAVDIARRCLALQAQIDVLRDQLVVERGALATHCPVAIGTRLLPHTRYQPAMVVETVSASVEDNSGRPGVIWRVSGPILTKTGKPHATHGTYRYVYGSVPLTLRTEGEA